MTISFRRLFRKKPADPPAPAIPSTSRTARLMTATVVRATTEDGVMYNHIPIGTLILIAPDSLVAWPLIDPKTGSICVCDVVAAGIVSSSGALTMTVVPMNTLQLEVPTA